MNDVSTGDFYGGRAWMGLPPRLESVQRSVLVTPVGRRAAQGCAAIGEVDESL